MSKTIEHVQSFLDNVAEKSRNPISRAGWSEPKNIKAALLPVPAFDSEILLPDALRGWVMDEADRMPCPPDFIAAGAIVTLSSIIGARCAIKPKACDSWLIVPNLWGGIVGLPSSKKSPAISVTLKPLERLIALAMESYQTDANTFEADKTVFEATKEAIESRIKSAAKAKDSKIENLTNIAKELQNHRENAPDIPILRRYKTNDTTVEKLGELLRDNPMGLLVLRDELIGLIASWDREGRESDRAFTVFEVLADFDPESWGASPADEFAKFPFFCFDEAAQEIFIEWSTELHRMRLQTEEHPIIEQHLSKFDKLFPALAIILHLVDCAASGRRGPVTAESALRAAAWCEYLEAHARRCYGLLMDDGLRAAQVLAEKLRQGKLTDKFTARDVRRNQWRSLTTDEAVQAALDWLEDEGWLMSIETGGNNRNSGRRM